MNKILFLLILCIFSLNIYAIPTSVIVRAKAKDAKFIGSSVGGALVIIREKMTGRILAEGLTEGGTGDTNLIMKTPHARNTLISDEGAAKFTAELDIEEPIFVRIEVIAPANKKQASVAASTEVWLIPGKDIKGDGIVLEIPGFIIDVLAPRTHQYIPLNSIENQTLGVKANVVMMCGCTVSDGGIWDANKFEVKSIVKRDGEKIGELDLKITSPNLFEGDLKIDSPGNYELIIYAYDPATGNTGVDKVNYVISP